jgi:hypothetical protein
MVAITNDVFMEFPLPAPLYRAKLFLMSRGGDEVQGVNPMDIRQRFASDFQAALLDRITAPWQRSMRFFTYDN